MSVLSGPSAKPTAIVDIGSNTVRLVVYAGAPRAPAIVFNEKVMAGLGSGLGEDGAIPEAAAERALAALRRFRVLIDQMDAGRVRVVATAAVRDATNGADFLARVRRIGLKPETLSGDAEAKMAALGVISSIPRARGVVGDLGGGSLELAAVSDGKVGTRVSLPLGVLRVADSGRESISRRLREALAGLDLARHGRGRPFYLVGGSWRALARLDMNLSEYPLPINHHYRMAPERAAALHALFGSIDEARLREIPVLSSRLPMLPGASLILAELVEAIRPSDLIVSSAGLREGLLYDALDARTRRRDPLFAAMREAGRGLGRFAEHGALLDAWIAPVFDDPPEAARLRMAACLLADIAWRAHPDFRAERGIEMALHGHWVGIDAPGRVTVAQALFRNFGGGGDFGADPVSALCEPEALERAAQWGLAMRLGQRLSAGLAAGLRRSSLALDHGSLVLVLKKKDEALFGEAVQRRLKTLANALGREPVLRLD